MLGCKMTQTEPTGELAIRVYVLKKRSPDELTDAELIPSMIEGVPTDVVESPLPTIGAAVSEPIQPHNSMTPRDNDRSSAVRRSLEKMGPC